MIVGSLGNAENVGSDGTVVSVERAGAVQSLNEFKASRTVPDAVKELKDPLNHCRATDVQASSARLIDSK